jgi:quinol monooxygenase YgiN
MELFIFARFHALPGNEAGVASALRKVIAPTRQEPSCLSIRVPLEQGLAIVLYSLQLGR